MKVVLLDENLPHNLRLELPGHDVTTVFYRGWPDRKNGELIALCQAHGIDVMITADQSLVYQQNFNNKHLGLVILPTNEPDLLKSMTTRILQAVNQAQPGSCQSL